MHLISEKLSDPVANDLTVIEFVGLPGSGKTTLANNLERVLLGMGEDVHTRSSYSEFVLRMSLLSKLRLCIASLSLCISHVVAAVRFSKSLRPMRLSTIMRAIRLPYAYALLSWYIKSMEGKFFVLDHGHLQSTVSAASFSTIGDWGALRTMGVHVYDNCRHLIVCILPDSSLSCQRLVNRDSKHSRMNALEGEHLYMELERSTEVIRFLRAEHISAGTKVIDIDGALSPNENAEIVIKNLFHG